MITWVNFLHIYQPPYQDKEVLRRISRESYERILSALENNEKAKITLNIQGCLIQQLIDNNLTNIIQRIKELIKKGQIELVSSAKFHPILPLIPKQEIVRQIELNDEINKKAFGDTYNPTGFFLPEMAYSKEVAKIIYNQGFHWIILDEISANQEINYSKKYCIQDTELNVIFRNRQISKTYVPSSIKKQLEKDPDKNQTIITATDGELYGHHHIDPEKQLEKILESDKIETQTVSKYLNSLKEIKWIDPIASSWESEKIELEKNIPFSLWDNPENPIHQKLWQIANIAIKAIEDNQDDSNLLWAQNHLDYGLASCTFWWASSKRFHEISTESWNPEEINKGLNQLVKTVRALNNLDKEIKIEVEYLAAETKKDIWQTHWKRINK